MERRTVDMKFGREGEVGLNSKRGLSTKEEGVEYYGIGGEYPGRWD